MGGSSCKGAPESAPKSSASRGQTAEQEWRVCDVDGDAPTRQQEFRPEPRTSAKNKMEARFTGRKCKPTGQESTISGSQASSSSAPLRPVENPEGGASAGAPVASHIYHERQLGGLCGVHCLNNLLQGPHFGPGDLAEIGVELDQEEQLLLNGGVETAEGDADAPKHTEYNVDSSADGGNFSIQVLVRALARFKLELLPSRHPKAIEPMKDPAKAAAAFLCQYRDHWFAIREVAECWWNLNSTRRRPALVSPFYLAAWLGQLGAEGYSIFLVCGGSLPDPAHGPDPSQEENFHEIAELIEYGKKAGGNPLAGGEADDSTPFVIPPELDSECDTTHAGFPPDIHYGQSLPWMPAVTPSMDPVANALQRQQQALAQCNAFRDGQTSMPSAAAPAGSNLGLGSFGNWFDVGNAAVPSETQTRTLLDMGFREPQVRVAQILCEGGGVEVISQRLTEASVGPELSGEQLGQAIQAAALSLDSSTSAAEGAVLKLVSLLSLDEDRLKAAAKHVDTSVLMELLISIMEQRSRTWPQNLRRAVDTALDLLAGVGQGSPRSSCSSPSEARRKESI